MSSGNFPACCAVTLDYEGGNDDDPHDPGGRTSRGILQREWDKWVKTHPGRPADVWKAPQADIVAIYREQYWEPVNGERWPVGLDLCVYDASVNSGLGAGLRWARAVFSLPQSTFAQLAGIATAPNLDLVGLIRKYQGRRLSFLQGLRTWSYFGKGWGRRVAGIEAIATKWALKAKGKPQEAVQADLEAAQASAAKKAAAGGSAAPAGPAGAAAHQATIAHHDWMTIAVSGVVIFAAVVLCVWCIHIWRVHSTRAEAFAKVAQ